MNERPKVGAEEGRLNVHKWVLPAVRRTGGWRPLADVGVSRHLTRMAALHKVTYDQRSGGPIAPIWWRLTPFFVGYAWLMAAMMMSVAYLCHRGGQPKSSAAAIVAGTFILLFVYWEKRRIGRRRRAFNESIAAYEREIPTSALTSAPQQP